MEGNPYSALLGLIRTESEEISGSGESAAAGIGAGAAKLRLGKVTQREPLKISVAGIEQPTSVLKINERLTRGATWKTKTTSPSGDYNGLTGNLSGPVSCGGALSTVTGGQLHSEDTVIDQAEVEQLEIDLEVGDELLLLTTDDQMFYILMKVVDAV